MSGSPLPSVVEYQDFCMAIDRLEADATRLLIDDHGRLTSVYAIAKVRRQACLALEQARIAEENSKL